MAASLPPKNATPTPALVQALYDYLTARIAGHPQAPHPWTFYEVLDTYLGPWGEKGYPIGYGIFYCKAFNGNPRLMASPPVREWVRKTTVRLQELLRDHVVERFKKGTLAQLTEKDLREYAFDSHPEAYDQGGLSMVALTAPELVPLIAAIPGKEFVPLVSDNLKATYKQLFATLGLVTPEVLGASLAVLAGPAHTGLFRRAIEMDQREFYRLQHLGEKLVRMKRAIESGRLDHRPWLEEIIRQLNATEFPDAGFAELAREVIFAAELRRQALREYYGSLLKDCSQLDAELRKLLQGQCAVSAWPALGIRPDREAAPPRTRAGLGNARPGQTTSTPLHPGKLPP